MMLTVDDADIDAVIEEIKQANGIDDAALATALAEQKWTMRRYRRELRRQVLMLKVRNVIVSQELRGVPSEEWAARADEVFGRWIEDRVAHAHIVKRDAE
jgi:SOS response regulatory protein OraA/RecX